jgi:hypothetical protein
MFWVSVAPPISFWMRKYGVFKDSTVDWVMLHAVQDATEELVTLTPPPF